jgi:hypothetical protein
MEKKELKEEIKKVLEGKSIYEMSPISGLNPMTKEEIIYWIVETYIDQELDKARDKAKIEVLTEIFQTCYQEDSKTRELVEEKLSKLRQ